jgi:hypothetical protein
MTVKKESKKIVVLTAPKLLTAWSNVCDISSKSENDIIESVEKFSKAFDACKLTVDERKTFIKGTKLISSFVSIAHVPALPTWSIMRGSVDGFKALPLLKQLSLATSSYDVLGVGVGEKLESADILKAEVAKIRKAKGDIRKAAKAAPTKAGKVSKTRVQSLKEILQYITALRDENLSDAEFDIMLEIANALPLAVSVDA